MIERAPTFGVVTLAFALAVAAGLATAQVANTKAEQGARAIGEAGQKATAATALDKGEAAALDQQTPPAKKTEEQGWLGNAEHLPSVRDGVEMKQPPIGTIIHSTRGMAFGDLAKSAAQTAINSWHFTVDRDGKIYQHLSLNSKGDHATPSEITLPNGRTTTSVNSHTIGIELANLTGTYVYFDGEIMDFKSLLWKPPSQENCKGPVSEPGWLPNSFRISSDLYNRLKGFGPKMTVEGVEFEPLWEEYPAEQIDGLVRLLKTIQQSKWKSALGLVASHAKVSRCPPGRKIDPGPLFPAEKLSEFNYQP